MLLDGEELIGLSRRRSGPGPGSAARSSRSSCSRTPPCSTTCGRPPTRATGCSYLRDLVYPVAPPLPGAGGRRDPRVPPRGRPRSPGAGPALRAAPSAGDRPRRRHPAERAAARRAGRRPRRRRTPPRSAARRTSRASRGRRPRRAARRARAESGRVPASRSTERRSACTRPPRPRRSGAANRSATATTAVVQRARTGELGRTRASLPRRPRAGFSGPAVGICAGDDLGLVARASVREEQEGVLPGSVRGRRSQRRRGAAGPDETRSLDARCATLRRPWEGTRRMRPPRSR